MWDLPRPGLEPVSPALAGRFLTTAPPGKPDHPFLLETCYSLSFVDNSCDLVSFHFSSDFVSNCPGDFSSSSCPLNAGFPHRWIPGSYSFSIVMPFLNDLIYSCGSNFTLLCWLFQSHMQSGRTPGSKAHPISYMKFQLEWPAGMSKLKLLIIYHLNMLYHTRSLSKGTCTQASKPNEWLNEWRVTFSFSLSYLKSNPSTSPFDSST